MSKLVIVGHGGYATAIERSMRMICGTTEQIVAIDFIEQDTIETLRDKLQAAISNCSEEQLLFCCDLTGGSPFNECIKLSMNNELWETVAGLNISAFADMMFALDLSPKELAERAVETTKESVSWISI
jgi:PTS system N-acetylgalactosamine-specific IIA component